jgi:hypothetical protein
MKGWPMTDDIELIELRDSMGRPLRFSHMSKPLVRRRQRKPSLGSALKQASKAGVNVVATYNTDGSISLAFGKEDAKIATSFDTALTAEELRKLI